MKELLLNVKKVQENNKILDGITYCCLIKSDNYPNFDLFS